MSVRQILGRIRQADQDYHLIQDNDTIAVGVSGGKDSLVLLVCLDLYQKQCLRHGGKSFQIQGIHIDMGFGNMDFSATDAYCQEKGIQLHHEPSKIYDILKLYPDSHGRISCSRCSTLKKGAVIKAAKEFGCTKTAFAHHADDAIETLFLNEIYGARLATFTPKMYLTRAKMTFIRPLVYVYEDEISRAIEELAIPVVKSTCPNDGYTQRQAIKETLQALYKEYPMAKENFLKMLTNTEKIQLWDKEDD